MKSLANALTLAASLALAGCTGQDDRHREVLAKLEALQSEMAKPRAEPVRWAYANKTGIRTAIYAWTRERAEELKRAEALPAETEAKVAEYEALRMELLRKPPQRFVPDRTLRGTNAGALPFPSVPGAVATPSTVIQAAARPAPTEFEKEYEALSRRVAEAKAPVAAIVERRSQLAAKYFSETFLEELVGEYAKDKYDLVVDTQDKDAYFKSVLYHAAREVPDVTVGIIQFFRSKPKP